jgi:4'-phosphopantetheinyl transferase
MHARLWSNAGGIDVWQVMLEIGDDEYARLWRLLSDVERARALRVRRPERMRHKVAGWGALREILSRYCEREPAQVAIERPLRGKPRLGSRDGSDLEFSCSYSGVTGVVAVGRCGALGVDLERVRPIRVEAFARAWCTASEQAWLAETTAAGRARVLLQMWTLKEAYLKALGRGVTTPPREVAACRRESAEVGGARLIIGAGPWRAEPVHAPSGYVAALARMVASTA